MNERTYKVKYPEGALKSKRELLACIKRNRLTATLYSAWPHDPDYEIGLSDEQLDKYPKGTKVRIAKMDNQKIECAGIENKVSTYRFAPTEASSWWLLEDEAVIPEGDKANLYDAFFFTNYWHAYAFMLSTKGKYGVLLPGMKGFEK